MAKDLQIQLYETLRNLLNSYSREPEEVLVLEAIANGMDANANKINIQIIKENEEDFIVFHNNGSPMRKVDFENYHTVSSSFKVKGEGIGFAGVGAKIFLGSKFETEIITITGKNEKTVLISRMYRDGKNIKYETNLEETIPESIQKIINNANLEHIPGTSYQVKLTVKGYTYLKQEITRIVQFWFNYAIISNLLQITVDGIMVEPIKSPTVTFKKTIAYKGQRINCYFYICKEVIPEEQRHIVYSVFGKRIKNESVDFSFQIVEDKSKKVSCEVDVSLLAKYLTTSKEDFHKKAEVNIVKTKIKEAFQKFLKENNLIKSNNNVEDTKEIDNDITKRLSMALQNNDLRFLNPFSKSTVQLLPISNVEGEIKISDSESNERENQISSYNNNDKLPKSSNNGSSKIGVDEEKNSIKDDKGEKTGTNKEYHSKEIPIIDVDFPNDEREGWIDFDNKAIIYNHGHKFAKSFEKNKDLRNYNLLRVIISKIIINKNDYIQMDAIKTFGYFNKLLQESWKK
jgi:hypothetical protein